MTNDLFPVHSDFDDDNIIIDPDFGARSPSSLEPPTQLETPLSQSILSMLIPFPTSHAGSALPANVTDGVMTNEVQTEYHPRSRRPAKVGHFDSGEYGTSTQHQHPTFAP